MTHTLLISPNFLTHCGMKIAYLEGIVDKMLKISAELSAFSNSSSWSFNMAIATWNRILDPSKRNKSHNLIMILMCSTLLYNVKNQLSVIKDSSISCSCNKVSKAEMKKNVINSKFIYVQIGGNFWSISNLNEAWKYIMFMH